MAGKKLLLIGPMPPPYGGWSRIVDAVLGLRDRPEFVGFTFESFNTVLHEGVDRKGNPLVSVFHCIQQAKACRIRFQLSKPDAVILFIGNGYSAWRDFFIMKACHKVGIPIIIRFIGGTITDQILAMRIMMRNMWLSQLRRCSGIHVELHAMEKGLSAALPEVPVCRVPNFLHANRLPFVEPARKSENPLRVVYFGNVTPKKGVETILTAAEGVCANGNVTFDFIGPELHRERGYLDEFRNRARSLKCADRIRIHGKLENEAMLREAANCHVFAFPSQWPGEGQPGALLEAMGLGLAPIVTDWRGLGEIVSNGHNGIVITAGDVAALQEGILRLQRDRQERERLAMAARAAILDEYDAAAFSPWLLSAVTKAIISR